MKGRAIIVIIVCILLIVLAVVMAMASCRARRSVEGAADSSGDESEDDLELGKVARGPGHSALLPHQEREVESALKKHFTDPRHIIDATGLISDDTMNFLRVFPRATITAIEVPPDTIRALKSDIRAVEQQLGRPAGAVKAVHANCVSFLQTTDEKADFVYLNPSRGNLPDAKACRIDLFLTDGDGRRWDTTEVVNLVFSRGIAPYVVLKAPYNFKTSDFSSRLEVPIAVHPIGQSRARHSSVSYWLIVAGGKMHSPPP